MTEPHPFVSVVIPSAQPRFLPQCLAGLLAQTYPASRYEIVVVSDGVEAETAAAMEQFLTPGGLPRVRMVARSRGGGSAARNTGLATAVGDPICFLDDDAVPSPGWLAGLVGGARRNADAGCVGGGVLPVFDAPAPRTCELHDLAGVQLDLGAQDVDVHEAWGGNMAVRRASLDLIGGFDEGLAVCQDWDWCRRLLSAGGRIVYIPDAWIWHRRTQADLRIPGLVRQYFRRGYVMGMRTGRPSLKRAWRGMVDSLAHALRHGCTRGLTDAAKSCGGLVAALDRQTRAWAAFGG